MGVIDANWYKFIQKLIDDSICAGIGVISKNVSNASAAEIQRITNIKQKNGYPAVEFWNHGYDHKDLKPHDEQTEFFNTNLNYQHSHINLAQHFFTDSLHITSHTFGAPHNRTQLITENVIEQFPEINVWQHYGRTEKYDHSGWKDPKYRVIHDTDQRIILSIDYLSLRSFNIDDMVKNYDEDRKKPYIIIQIHPAAWNDEIFQKFESIVQFYKQSHRATFMTPYQYYQFLHKKVNVADN
ncbi:MAG: hypothetical protein WCK78_04005 [Paludibacter sp.]